MGTPERYQKVQDDYDAGIPFTRNLENKQKAIFLDRDGTINKYVGFVRSPEEFELIDGVSDTIKKLNDSGYLVIVITNQPVIARGEVSVDGLNIIHNKMETLLGKAGAYVDAIYYCPHHPHKGYEGEVKELKIDCDCRKPKTGLIDRAVLDYNIDLEHSYIIGDSTMDMKLAENAGIKGILVKTGVAGNDNKFDAIPYYTCDTLNDAVDHILNKQLERKLR